MDLRLQESRDTPLALVQHLGHLRHTRVPMVLQALDPRGLHPTEQWVILPRVLNQGLPSLVQAGHQEAPLQEPLELHHQEVLLPLELLTIPADQEQTISKSWRTPSLKWRRRGCRETRDIMRPGGFISLSRLAQTVQGAIPRPR